MNTANMIFEICTFLSLEDLIHVQTVNKKFLSASSPILFKKEFYRLYFSETYANPTTSKLWKRITITMQIQESLFMKSASEFLSVSFVKNLYKKLISILSEPELPLPKVRKENFMYPTVLQDALANLNDSYYQSSSNLEDLLRDFETENLNLNTVDNVVNSFCSVFSNLIMIYCESYRLRIAESADILKEYLSCWEKFAFSVEGCRELIESFLRKLEGIELNILSRDVLRYLVSLYKHSVDTWKKKVFFKIENDLNKIFLGELEKAWNSDGEWEDCLGYFESLVDISLDHQAIHYKEHSKNKSSGPVRELEIAMLNFFQNKNIDNERRFRNVKKLFKYFPSNVCEGISQILNLEKYSKKEYENYISQIKYRDCLIEKHKKKMNLVVEGLKLSPFYKNNKEFYAL